MKGWKLVDTNKIELVDIENDNINSNFKIKTTKALVTMSDFFRYNGQISSNNIILGSYGIGIVSDFDAEESNFEKGQRVYVESFKSCGKCYNCINGENEKCSETSIAGEDFDGFLSDFVLANQQNLFSLPENVSDNDALFIGQISQAIAVIDKLKVKKGDYVAVIGANNFGIILSQLLMYYQAVPILLSVDDEDLEIAKKSGIYYRFNKDDNWQKEVSNLTGGRMAESVVYISNCGISIQKAFALSSYSSSVAFIGDSSDSFSMSGNQSIKKQLSIHFINNGIGNTETSINILANKALDLSHLIISECEFNKVNEMFEKMLEDSKSCKIRQTIVKIV